MRSCRRLLETVPGTRGSPELPGFGVEGSGWMGRDRIQAGDRSTSNQQHVRGVFLPSPLHLAGKPSPFTPAAFPVLVKLP